MSFRYDKVVWWIKRDLRLADNDALLRAIDEGRRVLPLFVFEPEVLQASDASFFHLHAQWNALAELSKTIEDRGGLLQIVQGEAVAVFDQLLTEDGFDAIYSHQETGADVTYQRDIAVANWCSNNNIHWHESFQNGVIRKLHTRDDRQRIFKERLLETPPNPAPQAIVSWQPASASRVLPDIDSISVNKTHCGLDTSLLQTVSEKQAQRECLRFLTVRGLGYSGGISSPNTAFKVGSRLSPHLAWGTISLRSVFHESNKRLAEISGQQDANTAQWRKSVRAFQSRLHWHDHFIQRLESAPAMEFEALNPAYRHIDYSDDLETLAAWSHGKTGIPLLDACMRCLRHTGFLNFRMRAMAVTTACFGLGQSWRSIHNPLAQVFLDYEPGIHLSQIQMQAGIVGINTLRVYSPHKQLTDQDPNCVFVKQWIPELREFSPAEIAAYNSTCLGDYPKPIVDINARGKYIKDQVYAIRKSEEGKEASAIVLQDHGSRRPSRNKSVKRKKAANKTQALPSPQMKLDF